jgi:hypothetical protein
MDIISRYFVVLALVLCASLSFAHGEQKHHDMTPPDSLAVSVAVDSKGKLWRVSVSDGFVEITHSEDLGETFTKPVRANTEKQNITAHGEIRPKLAVGKNGEIYVTWMQSLRARFSGHIWFARSMNGGKSFEKPFLVHQDRAEISHAFEQLQVAPDGKITVLWLDARDAEADKKAGKKRSGSSIYYAASTNAGKTFAPEQKLADYSCECCRIATTIKQDGTIAVMWRHVFAGSERDHAIAEVNTRKPPVLVRASYGRWKIEGCPHHGGALAVGEGFGYHMAYFDGAGDKPSLMVARMDGEAWVTSPPKKFGNMKNNAGHPSLLSLGEKVWLVWRETNPAKATEIYLKKSDDGGKSWEDAKLVFTTKDKSDYPQLIENKGRVYLAINTAGDGFKLVELSEISP